MGYSATVGATAIHAFLYSGGVMRDIGTLGGTNSTAFGINDSGQVAGVSDTIAGFAGYDHAFLYSNGRMQDLGTLGGDYSTASAINDRGQVVGLAVTADGSYHVFLYSNGAMQDLNTLSGVTGVPYGLNNNGQIVGYADNANGQSYAFLYSEGVEVDLNSLMDPSLGVSLTDAHAINDLGQIAVDGIVDGRTNAFLLTPVPEPSTWALLGSSGLLLLGLLRSRTKHV